MNQRVDLRAVGDLLILAVPNISIDGNVLNRGGRLMRKIAGSTGY